MWAVIFRELRAESRRPFTYWLRIIGAVGILATVCFSVYESEEWAANSRGMMISTSPSVFGRLLFGRVNAAFFAMIWILVPLLTADCITREKREGTLGLLFLTPLTARGVVVGKVFVHGIRAMTFLLAIVPALAVPLLMGGVDPKDLLMALILDSMALLLALSAGLLASSWMKQWIAAVIVAEVLSALFAVTLMWTHLHCFESMAVAKIGGTAFAGRGGWGAFGGSGVRYHPFGPGLIDSLLTMFQFSTASGVEVTPSWVGRSVAGNVIAGGMWSSVWTSGRTVIISGWFKIAAGMFACACLLAVIAVHLAATRVRRSWRLQTSSTRMLKFEKEFCRPQFLLRLFRSRMSRSLERNPIGWLQQYSVSARLAKWGWCLFVVVVESVLSQNITDVESGQSFVFIILLLALAFSAAASFRRERETGALELLLVTPLRVSQVVCGRLGGLWRQFLPAGLVASTSALYVAGFGGSLMRSRDFPIVCGIAALLCASAVAISVVGLYFSLGRGNILVAWLGVVAATLGIPWCVTLIWSLRTAGSRGSELGSFVVFLLVQAAITWLAGARLVANLSSRRFLAAA